MEHTQERATEANNARTAGIGLMLLVAVLCVVWILQSWAEASAFERITGKHVTVWDAMFVDLRIQESVR